MSPRRRRRAIGLTPREREVAQLIADGLTHKAISVRLGVSKSTVDRHVDNIGAKVGQDPERPRRDAIRRFVERAA